MVTAVKSSVIKKKYLAEDSPLDNKTCPSTYIPNLQAWVQKRKGVWVFCCRSQCLDNEGMNDDICVANCMRNLFGSVLVTLSSQEKKKQRNKRSQKCCQIYCLDPTCVSAMPKIFDSCQTMWPVMTKFKLDLAILLWTVVSEFHFARFTLQEFSHCSCMDVRQKWVIWMASRRKKKRKRKNKIWSKIWRTQNLSFCGFLGEGGRKVFSPDVEDILETGSQTRLMAQGWRVVKADIKEISRSNVPVKATTDVPNSKCLKWKRISWILHFRVQIQILHAAGSGWPGGYLLVWYRRVRRWPHRSFELIRNWHILLYLVQLWSRAAWVTLPSSLSLLWTAPDPHPPRSPAPTQKCCWVCMAVPLFCCEIYHGRRQSHRAPAGASLVGSSGEVKALDREMWSWLIKAQLQQHCTVISTMVHIWNPLL